MKETVTIPRLGLPPAPPGVIPVPLDRSFDAVEPVDLPTRPADPVWPPLPTPVELPVAPFSPGPEPTAAVVVTPRRDPVGPGCGWAFTGQGAPTYDAAAAAATRAATIDAARGRLLLAQQAWRAAVVGYWQASARFETATVAYAFYADQVRSVGVAWSAIEQARADYRSALVAYRAAVSERDALLAEQATALRAYQAALAACAVVPTTPPAPTVPATPEQPGASGPPATSPTTPAPVCPPPRPAVLDRPVPPVPVPPVPPPDPRPAAPPASTPGGPPTR